MVVAGRKRAPSEAEFNAATQQLLKVMMDQYVSGDMLGVHSLITIFLEMLDSDEADVMVNAFDLLLTLSVHAHSVVRSGVQLGDASDGALSKQRNPISNELRMYIVHFISIVLILCRHAPDGCDPGGCFRQIEGHAAVGRAAPRSFQ